MNTVFYSFFVSGLAGLSTLLGIFLTIVSTIQNRSSKLENSNDTKEDRPSIDYSKLNVSEEEAIKFFTGQ